ncbi:EVE domain-containing protein [Phaeodactylibacter luteus]|uniref:EVE domain-containing protein n=1 Tax=Phaeodactylibacter luteus TaxID=1564516 RepID=A0A5C6S5H9_9BACT|nr:EVE domain-containing protein [Phaeodactylibacter luteus]TXB69537.1 EVE domain-containing protein [Phaeodactylibacter luteus]
MNYWLVKSEPEAYGYQDLEQEGTGRWDGVRNYAARNHLRGMKAGDYVLFYHSRTGLEVVGICKVEKEAYPDPTAEKGDWSAVDLSPFKRLKEPVSLKAIKSNPKLQDMPLARIGRLSVMPLSEAEFLEVLRMGGTEW